MITGTGGIGKTTLQKHFFLNTIKSNICIPIFVELRNMNNVEISIKNYIYALISDLGFDFEQKYFEYSLESGYYIFILDGFDEIKSEKSNFVSKEIQRMADKYPDNFYILTSRPTDMFIGWSRFTEQSYEFK